MALGEHERAGHLGTALESNRQIGTALGIMMIQRKCTAEDALTALRVVSQNCHRKLRDVAEDVLFTGALPELPPTRPKAGSPAAIS